MRLALYPALALLCLAPLSRPAIAEPDDASPRLAVATDPVGLITGRYALSATYVASAHVSVRGDITVEQSDAMATRDDWRVSVGLPLYLDRPLRGPFVEPGVALAHRLAYAGLGGIGGLGAMSGLVGMTYQDALEPQLVVGWQWLYGSRWHVAAAIGAARTPVAGGSHAAIPLSYLRVGIAL